MRRMSIFAFVLCLLFSRMVIKTVAYLIFVQPHEVEDTEPRTVVERSSRREVNAAPSDPQRIQEDLQRVGQVVRRYGRLVVLIDDSDPDNEVYTPLNPADADALLFGVDPVWPSLGMGTVIFLVFAGGYRLVAGSGTRQGGDNDPGDHQQSTKDPSW